MSDDPVDPSTADGLTQRTGSVNAPLQKSHGDKAALDKAAPTLAGSGLGQVATVLKNVESLLSVTFFLGMFAVILVGVFFRYVLNSPLTWSVAVASSLFIWTTMVTAGLPHWNDEHIQFDIFYLRFNVAGQRWARIVGNLILIIPAVIVIPASFRYLKFIYPQKIGGLGLSLTWAFAGIAYFYVTTALHRGRLLVIDVMSLRSSHRARTEGPS